MSAKEANPLRKVRTVPGRMSHPYLLECSVDEESGRKTYQLGLLFPPGFDRKPYDVAMTAAMEDKYGTDREKWPKLKRGPKDVVKDFGEYNASRDKPLPGDWKGWTMIRASSSEDYPPGIVGPVKDPKTGKFPTVTDKREVYGGRWARMTIDAYVYERKDGKGVTFGLKNVQLLKHAEAFGKPISAPEDDFDNAEGEWAGEADAFDKGDTNSSDWG